MLHLSLFQTLPHYTGQFMGKQSRAKCANSIVVISKAWPANVPSQVKGLSPYGSQGGKPLEPAINLTVNVRIFTPVNIYCIQKYYKNYQTKHHHHHR